MCHLSVRPAWERRPRHWDWQRHAVLAAGVAHCGRMSRERAQAASRHERAEAPKWR